MANPVLLVENKDGVTTLTLNRPEKMNALSGELRATLAAELTRLHSDPDTGALILTGAGRAFCAGLDLVELGSREHAGELVGAGGAGSGTRMWEALAALERPVIGAINGVAVTGGFELALCCDVLVATPEARFADTHARVGIIPGAGLSQRLSRAIGIYRAKELSLTGNFLSAEQAYEWGLVNRVVPREELLPTCHALAQDMLSCVPEVMRAYKRLMDRGYAMSLGDGLVFESAVANLRNAGVQPGDVAERREAILNRGRDQSARGGKR